MSKAKVIKKLQQDGAEFQEGYDSMGYRTPILHVLTIDDARQLRDELTAVIKQCVIAEAVKHNSSNDQAHLRVGGK
jgi:hypothetical protein